MRFDLFRNQPRGLLICFTTEMWERFSYYGMRALLVFFLTQHWGFSDQESYLIYGAYTSLVYMMPVLGGLIADRYLGSRKAVAFGAILLVIGHFGMTLEGPQVTTAIANGGTVMAHDRFYLSAFYLSLAFIITGVGFLKTNISTLVGALYPHNDARRDAGFTIFYMGINVGGAAAPLLCGWLGQTYGWGYGFGLAGVGMLIGLLGFLRGQRHLLGHAEPPPSGKLRERVLIGVRRESLVYAGSISLVFAVWIIMQHQEFVGHMLAVCGVFTGLGILYFAQVHCTRVERDRLLVCATLIVFTIGFWAFYEQMGSSLNLFGDRMVDRVVLGHEIPASMFQALPAIFAIVLAPLFAAMWLRLAARGREPNTTTKFSLAIMQLALGFLLLVFGTTLTVSNGKVALVWYILTFLLLVTGEICLVPVGLAMVTRLAPKRVVGVMMGVFFLAYSGSSFISGLIAQLTRAKTIGGELVNTSATLSNYASVYMHLAIIALIIAAVLYLVSPVLQAGSHESDAMARSSMIGRFYFHIAQLFSA